MPAEPVLLLVAVAILANLILMGVVLLPSGADGQRPFDGGDRGSPGDRVAAQFGAMVGGAPGAQVDGVPATTYDRVVRIVSWIFILATGSTVAVTGLWPGTQPQIFILLAISGLFVLVIHDLLPPDALGNAKFIVEGSFAVTMATLLVLLTGRESSPFFFVFPLIVGGAALVVSPRVTLGLASVASLGYLAAVVVGRQEPLHPASAAMVGINLSALILLAYVAMVIAREQRRSRQAAIRASTIDSLTGLFNRTFFFAALEREIERSARSGRGFCLLMMDLDELKGINDRYGHFHGDRILRSVGDVIRAGVRRIDIAARYGGDEFVVLLPETDPTGAYVLAEKIRLGTAELDLEGPAGDLHASVSIGVVAYPDDGTTTDELMITADQAMYTSKRGGKNRVMGSPVAGPSDRETEAGGEAV
jgi:diguanylate cyclase (GGDEF)-like protein